MNALLLKDLLNLKTTAKSLCFMMLIFCVIFIPLGNIVTMYFLLMIFGVMLPVTTLSLDEVANWDRYALTMPVSRRDLVRSKFILMIVLTLFGMAFSLVLTAVAVLVLPDFYAGSIGLFTIMAVIFALSPLYGSIILPVYYKFGIDRMRYIMIALMAIIGAMIVGFFMVFEDFVLGEASSAFGLNPAITVLAALVVSLAVMAVSYRISCGIYERKEF